jgi:hypothetical protein
MMGGPERIRVLLRPRGGEPRGQRGVVRRQQRRDGKGGGAVDLAADGIGEPQRRPVGAAGPPFAVRAQEIAQDHDTRDRSGARHSGTLPPSRLSGGCRGVARAPAAR